MSRMGTTLRKFVLTSHVVVSLGWFGGAAAVLALAVAGLVTADSAVASSVYLGTEVIWRFVIIPLSLGALLTGLIQAFGTEWGLFRHSWVLAKFVITVGAVLLLLLHTNSLLPSLARAAIDRSGFMVDGHAHGHGGIPPRIHLVVAAGGTLLLLIATTALAVYKPWGRTPFGRRPPEGV
jgi:hypothetical protein